MNATKQIPKIIKRDGLWCHLCGYQVLNVSPSNPHPAAPTRDRVIPKTLGGTMRLHNMRLAHRYCNSHRGVGAEATEKAKAKRERFIQMLVQSGTPRKPGFSGADLPQTEIPDRFKTVDSRKIYFALGKVQFEVRTVAGRYWHLRIGTNTNAITELGYEQKLTGGHGQLR